eukprot:TRINITY_DN33917_c0_g1_i1.p1 TRINITY_DN33917_c0_g1~~TRINITY_DN33917_c0_g1_i1.p1  ORF type:complete len:574 (+),score=95.11 TRINITY_DN33917_c0_g1_i1:143-1864(+)
MNRQLSPDATPLRQLTPEIPLELRSRAKLDSTKAQLAANLDQEAKRTKSVSVFVKKLSDAFGWKLLVTLFVSQHLMKGMLSGLVAAPTQFIYRSLNVSAPQVQVFTGIAALPWAMKPVLGLLSDHFPICGLHKAPYLLIASLLGTLAVLVLALANLEQLGVQAVVVCFFLVNAQLSACDLLTEAKYAEQLRAKPQHGPDLMTFVWWGLNFASLLATMISGPLLSRFGNQAPYILSLPFTASIIFPTMANFLEEKKLSAEEVRDCRRKVVKHPVMLLLCVLMFLGTTLMTVVGVMFESVALNAAVAIGVAIVMLSAFSVTLSPMIAKVNAFFVMQTALGLSTGGATFYFFTDLPEQYAEGPHFSLEFYVSVLGIVGAVFSLVGISTYNRYMQTWTYRKLLLLTNLMGFLLSWLDVLIFTRGNLKLGIPDHLFVLGSSVSETIVFQWRWMPGILFLSQLCPKGMEATMYALLAGCHNLGSSVASSCGALALQWLQVQPNGQADEASQFDNLWKASALSSLLSFATCILLPFFIPDVRQTDTLLTGDAASDPSHNSLWRRWFRAEDRNFPSHYKVS